jgi:putative ATP-dependent endonuclease of OLD family
MRIADVRIKNFRGIKKGRVTLGRHTVFIGPNNSGKTTVIEALTLLFGRDRLVRQLTEHDFYGGDPKAPDRILLVATVTGFTPDDPGEHPEWFRDGRGVPKWLDDTTGDLHASRDHADWNLACQIAYCARFDRPSLEMEAVRYFHDDDEIDDPFTDQMISSVPTLLIREIGFFLVPANRTWDRIVSFASELFRRIVESADAQPSESVLAERDRLRVPAQPLESDGNLAAIVANLNGELAGFFRGDPALRLRLTTTDSQGVLDAVVPHYGFRGGEPVLPARRHGSGLVSLQGLLLLLEFGRRRAENDEGFFMALEEPELHVPPPLQRRLMRRLQGLSTQTVVSTHSPVVAAMSDPRTISILRNEAGILSSTRLQTGTLPAATPNGVRKLFQLNRIDTVSALMHDVVLIPEGSTDYEWLNLLVRAIDSRQDWSSAGESTFGSYIGVVPTHDAAVRATFEALSPLHPRIATLVDGDSDGVRYAQELATNQPAPSAVLRWADGWTIENVIGWIADADASAALTAMGSAFPRPASTSDLVRCLKAEDRSSGGLKQDRIAYEEIAGVIGSVEACRAKARDLLNALSDACRGKGTAQFADDPTCGAIRVFKP